MQMVVLKFIAKRKKNLDQKINKMLGKNLKR